MPSTIAIYIFVIFGNKDYWYIFINLSIMAL